MLARTLTAGPVLVANNTEGELTFWARHSSALPHAFDFQGLRKCPGGTLDLQNPRSVLFGSFIIHENKNCPMAQKHLVSLDDIHDSNTSGAIPRARNNSATSTSRSSSLSENIMPQSGKGQKLNAFSRDATCSSDNRWKRFSFRCPTTLTISDSLMACLHLGIGHIMVCFPRLKKKYGQSLQARCLSTLIYTCT